MPNLIELCESVDKNYSYYSLKNLKFARKDWSSTLIKDKSIYVKIDTLEVNFYHNIFTFVYYNDGIKTPLYFTEYFETDWYIIEENENNVDSDIIENFKMRLISVVKDIDDFQYTILKEKNNKKHLTK